MAGVRRSAVRIDTGAALPGKSAYPGRAVRRLYAWASDLLYARRTATSVDAVEAGYLLLLACFLGLGWLGLILAEFGWFSLPNLLVAAALAAGVLAVAVWRVRPSFAIVFAWDALAVLPVLALAWLLYASPFERIIGGSDPGVYVSTGAYIAREGSVTIHDPLLAGFSPEVRSAVFPFRTGPTGLQILGRGAASVLQPGGRLPGFHIVGDGSAGVVQPHGFHLYPTMLAIGQALGGIRGNLWMSPIIAIMAALAVFLAVRRLFGTPVALLGAVLLVVNPGEIFFARYPVAEILVQLCLFGGALAFAAMLDTRSRGLAVLAGFALGAAHLTKIEIISLPVALAGFFGYFWLTQRWRAEYSYFLVTYALMGVHAALHAHFFAGEYFYYHLDLLVFSALTPARIALIVAAAVVLVLAVTVGRRRLGAVLTSSRWPQLGLPVTTSLVLLLALFAYIVRPYLAAPSGSVTNLAPEALTAWANGSSYLILGWYVTTIGLLLAPLGFVVALKRGAGSRTALVLGLALLETLVYLADAHVNPVHFWAARRYVPMVFPAFAIFSAYAIWSLQASLGRRWPENVLPAGLALVLVASTFGGWLPMRGHVEMRGAVDQVGALAETIPEGAVVVFDDTLLAQHLATPLTYIWQRPSVVLLKPYSERYPEPVVVAELLRQPREVYLILDKGPGDGRANAQPPLPIESWGFEAEPVASVAIDVPYAADALDHLPNRADRLKYNLQVYRLSEQAR